MEQLKILRNKANLTQAAVAKKLGIDRSTYTKYETGQSEPNFEMLQRISALYGTSIGSLFANEEAPSSKEDAHEITYDDFSYAMHNETKDLPPEKKEMLLQMARFMNAEQKKEGTQ